MKRIYFSDGVTMPIRESAVIVYKLTNHAVEMKKINDVIMPDLHNSPVKID